MGDLSPVPAQFLFTAAHAACLYQAGLGRPYLWDAKCWIETQPDNRGGMRVAVLAERPRWPADKGDPERPGTRARLMTDEERRMTLDELRAHLISG